MGKVANSILWTLGTIIENGKPHFLELVTLLPETLGYLQHNIESFPILKCQVWA